MFLADLRDTLAAGRRLAEWIEAGDVIALSGPLGTGKTSLVRGMLRGLGFAGDVPSPSFAIAIPYAPPDVRVPVLHVDLYRIECATEIEELGLDDARADSALVIEWPERMGERLWPDTLRLAFAIDAPGRFLTATVPPSWEARWP